MDNFILEKKLKWIPYKKFEDVEYLNEGGFGSVYKATWLKENGDMVVDMEVVLKCPKDLNENLSKFLKEWKYHESCLDSTEIINLPSALKVKNIIKNWIFNSEISDISDINEELKSNIMEFINASIQCNNLITESHPQVCHTSRLLSFTSKELNKILENEDTHVYYLSHSTSGKVNEIQESGSLRDCIIINEDTKKDEN
ncbi:unnamed protein product [Rhizophagus irregularis]|nr:unnamed protein product [Rhizophagus irregularis]